MTSPQTVLLPPGDCAIIPGGYANPSILATDSVIITGQNGPARAEHLKWTATVASGSLQINVCISQKLSPGISGAVQIDSRKINILVLRQRNSKVNFTDCDCAYQKRSSLEI